MMSKVFVYILLIAFVIALSCVDRNSSSSIGNGYNHRNTPNETLKSMQNSVLFGNKPIFLSCFKVDEEQLEVLSLLFDISEEAKKLRAGIQKAYGLEGLTKYILSAGTFSEWTIEPFAAIMKNDVKTEIANNTAIAYFEKRCNLKLTLANDEWLIEGRELFNNKVNWKELKLIFSNLVEKIKPTIQIILRKVDENEAGPELLGQIFKKTVLPQNDSLDKGKKLLIATQSKSLISKEELLLATNVIAKMLKTYKECFNYQDKGIVTVEYNLKKLKNDSNTIKLWFNTVYSRLDRFRFEYQYEPANNFPMLRHIIWACGKDVRMWNSYEMKIERSEDLDSVTSSVLGDSNDAIHIIPGLLIPSKMDWWCWVNQITEIKEFEEKVLNNKDKCYCIKIAIPNRELMLWIDKAKLLILRIDEQTDSIELYSRKQITYDPIVNIEIDQKLLDFRIPEK